MTVAPRARSEMRRYLDVGVTLLMICAATTALWVSYHSDRATPKAEAPPPREALSLADSIVQGHPNARIALVMFSDFQCPFCRAFARDSLPTLRARYVDTGRILFVYKYYPLVNAHPLAMRAAETAECARRQNQFWEMADKLFSSTTQDKDPASYAPSVVALDRGRFDDCLAQPPVNRIQADVATARRMGVSGTPTLFVGDVEANGQVKLRTRLTGDKPIETVIAAIEKELSSVHIG